MIMKEQSVAKGEESSHLAVRVTRAKNLGQGQGQDLGADPEVGQEVGRALEVGHGQDLSLEVGQGRGQDPNLGREVDQQGQNLVQGLGQGQNLVVQQGHDQGRNQEVLPGQDQEGLVREVRQYRRNREMGHHRDHLEGQRSRVRGRHILEEGQGVRLKTECWNCKYIVNLVFILIRL